MLKRLFPCLAFCLAFSLVSLAQSNGVLPLTGMKYFKEGIQAQSIAMKIDGAQLLSNRIPFNKDIELLVGQPTGFAADAGKKVYAGAELVIVSPKGEVLLKTPNLLLPNEGRGYTAKEISELSIKFNITPKMLSVYMNGTLQLRLYDLKSKSQMRFEMPVTFSKMGEQLQVSNTAKTILQKDGAVGVVNGLKAKKVLVSVDTSIKVSPKMAYTSLDVSAIEGSSISGIFSGKETFWVYDENLNEVKITDMLLKQVKGAMENNNVDYTLKIPYKQKNTPAKVYTVRFRWESPDKKQLIDVVVRI
ncbi:MAG TPA: hypothetical protein PLT49_07210 [Ferruginibacter sp.]|nr:hypothetical protein [Chitinophagales bacterium]HMU73062.1 hypothetical protein [Ferruginibacter sp.]HMX80197.1 hypothetical protein [Ferruginibacter sp.]HNF43441.1 hypothetical protein [Ferruginibacter sp.]HNJ30003.1 hypothetical protein [Ferruginibacter sp.]